MSVELLKQSNHSILCHPCSSCPQSFPTSGSFPMSSLFASGGQSTGASSSVIPMNNQGDFLRIDWFGFLAVQGTLKSVLQHNLKPSVLWRSAFFCSNSHIRTEMWKNHSFHYSWPLSAKWCLCFLIHCLDLYSFSSKERLFISWLQSLSTVTSEPKKIKPASSIIL